MLGICLTVKGIQNTEAAVIGPTTIWNPLKR